MARTWFGEIPFCCSLTLLLGPAWVLLKYVLQTIFSGPANNFKHKPNGVTIFVSSLSRSFKSIHIFHSIQNETSAVRTVAAKSYEEDVHTAVKDAIVFFHAPW